MLQKQTRDFLIRNMPSDLYDLLEKSAREHHRSKTQEAIIALKNGLQEEPHVFKKPTPFKWKSEISNTFIDEAINEGRE